ncbi:helix-turn-helix protein [Tamaricihabitans halophyticus]|uniref:Helix-turn-helix protein n=1 Tax=Tamaricihabitans halophyticus TaxID=1262583 RepID=A0A4V2SUV6_9PSEU|nr:helix-turn-helix transcriptional regulator [Tamaricihabitans halophyticus]TCP56076.1 helix-turn-helix protein [Tamaricihabitans halophyticus]
MREPENSLSATLRSLRKAAGLSGAAAAKRAGLTQSKVSRTETGAFMPTVQQVEALCLAYDAPASVRRRLVRMAHELSETRISAQVELERGGWLLQERIGRVEESAERIRSVGALMIQGLLQTESYMRALFGDSLAAEDLDRTVAARVSRQQLLDTDRHFTFVLAEGAVRWNMGGSAVMIAQLDRIIEESRRDNIDIGVVPWTTPVFVPLLHSFEIYDSRAVLFGTQTATALVTDATEVGSYENHWAELDSYVSFGDEAREIIARARQDYMTLS